LKKQVFSLLGILLLLFSMTTAYADEPPPPPRPWRRDLGNGLVFHYRPEPDHYSPHRFPYSAPTFEAQGYPQTGLYLNGELVYTVDVHIWGALYFSNDGMSFLEVDWWVGASGDPGVHVRYREPVGSAVRFFNQGELVHVFEVPDLVHNQSRLIFSVSHAQWDYQGERVHNRENETFQVTTRDGRIITFDLTNGLIQSTQRMSFVRQMQMRIDNDPWFWSNLVENPVIGWTLVIVSLFIFAFILFIAVRFLRTVVKRLRIKSNS
jgi:hypothetical protein